MTVREPAHLRCSFRPVYVKAERSLTHGQKDAQIPYSS